MSEQRKHYIDRAKIIAMLMVIMVHVGGEMGLISSNHFSLYSVLMACYMHIFIVCSGLVCSAKDRSFKELWLDLKKRTMRLLIPFVLFFLIHVWALSREWADAWFSYPKLGAWYLLVLWECYLLHYLFIIWRKRFRTVSTDLLWGICITIALKVLYHYLPAEISAGLSLEGLQVYYPYFFAAMWMQEYHLTEKVLQRKWFVPVLFFLCIGAFLAKYHFHMPFTSELCTITSTLLLIQLMYLLERISISGMKSIDFLGKETLAIYLIHFMYLYLLPLGHIHTYIHAAPMWHDMGGDIVVLFLSICILLISFGTGKLFKLCVKQ